MIRLSNRLVVSHWSLKGRYDQKKRWGFSVSLLYTPVYTTNVNHFLVCLFSFIICLAQEAGIGSITEPKHSATTETGTRLEDC